MRRKTILESDKKSKSWGLKMLYKFAFILFFISIFTSEASQDSLAVDFVFEKEQLQPFDLGGEYVDRYLGEKEFQYIELNDGENWFQKLKRKANELLGRVWSWIIGNKTAGKFLSFFIQVLPYLLLLGLSILMIWLFVKYENRKVAENKLNGSKVAFGSDEEIIQNQDIQQLINHAISRGDFRLAIRYYYLLTLKKLIEKDLIEWKIQKTNHDYFEELSVGPLKVQFVEITKIYDYIWYGDFDLDQLSFQKAEGAFHKLDRLL